MDRDAITPEPVGHVVLVGDDRLGTRVLEELCELGVEVVVVCAHVGEHLAQAAEAARVPLVLGAPHDEETLRRAHVGSARACGLLGGTDLANLHVALSLQELQTQARIVMRLQQASLGESVRELVGDVSVLSPIELAGPAFVHAALRDSADFVLRLGERRVAVQEIDGADPALRLALASADDDRDDGEIFPVGAARVIGIVDQGRVEEPAPSTPSGSLDMRIAARETSFIEAARRSRRAWQTSARFMTGVFDRRLALVAAVFGAVVVVSSIAFRQFLGIGLIDSLYFVVVTVTTTGYGDINLLGASTTAKLTGVALMLFGVLILSVVVALAADAVLGARLAHALGHGALPKSGHVIVCGVGRAGSHIIEHLVEAGVPCVAVERDKSAPDLVFLRNHKVPLVIGDASSAQTLESLRLQSARALIAMTSDDLVNLQCALLARARAPHLRVVLRVFDTDLARRVERRTGYVSCSVDALAAPAFVATLLGHRAAAVVPVGQEVMRLVWMKTGGPADVRSLELGCEARVLAVDAAAFPGPGEPIPPGTEVLVVGTRRGLAQIEPRFAGGGEPIPIEGFLE